MDEKTMQKINEALSQVPLEPEFTFEHWYKQANKWLKQEYTVNFTSMTQRNNTNGTVRKLKAVWQEDEKKEFSWLEHLDNKTFPAPPGTPAPPPQGDRKRTLADDSTANQKWIATPQDPTAMSFPSGSQPSSGSQWKEYDKPRVVPEVGDGKSSDTMSEWEMTQDEEWSWGRWNKKQ